MCSERVEVCLINTRVAPIGQVVLNGGEKVAWLEPEDARGDVVAVGLRRGEGVADKGDQIVQPLQLIVGQDLVAAEHRDERVLGAHLVLAAGVKVLHVGRGLEVELSQRVGLAKHLPHDIVRVDDT